MNRSVLHILLALGLMTYSGCTSKDAKDELASPAGEELGESDSQVFDELSEDEFFATAEEPGLFDNEAPAEALGEVPPLEDAPMPGTDGFAEDGAFAAVDPAADPGTDFQGDAFSESGPDPFASGGSDPFADGGSDPFADLAQSEGVDTPAADPFGATDSVDPMVAEEPVPTEPAAPLGDGFFEEDSTLSVASSNDDVENDGSSSSGSNLVPVVKIKDTPYHSAGQLLNTVYIVRPDDTIESVSQKIYGSDKSSDILAANPHLHRSFKPGDKLYYNSPNRPTDESQLLTFHADQGVRAESYVSQEGDNIRKVSSDLLGFDGAWKEVWATNPHVESKWLLNGGVELKYWKGGGSSTPRLAKNDLSNSLPSPAPMPVAEAPEFEEPALPVEQPNENTAANEFAPPAPENFDEPEMADFDSLPPPSSEDFAEPPVDDLAMNDLPPPPPPPPAFRDQGPASLNDAQKNVANAEDSFDDPMAMLGGMDDDMMMLVGALAVIILGGGILMVVRKRKARESELEDALSDSTQVG